MQTISREIIKNISKTLINSKYSIEILEILKNTSK